MMFSKLTFDSFNLGATVDGASISKVELKSDNSGDWVIELNFNVRSQPRNVQKNKSVSVSERSMLSTSVVVLLQEILAASQKASIDDMSISELHSVIFSVASTKLFTALGVQPTNVTLV